MIGCIAGVVGLVDDVEGFAEGDVLSTGRRECRVHVTGRAA